MGEIRECLCVPQSVGALATSRRNSMPLPAGHDLTRISGTGTRRRPGQHIGLGEPTEGGVLSSMGLNQGRRSITRWSTFGHSNLLISSDKLLMFTQTCREAFCDYRNAVLHNARFDGAGFVAKLSSGSVPLPPPGSAAVVPSRAIFDPRCRTDTGGLLCCLLLMRG